MPLPTITYLPISDTTHIEFYPGSIKHSKLSDDENLRFDYDLNKRLLAITIESTPALVRRYGYNLYAKSDVPEKELLLLPLEHITAEYCKL